ncbi:hypothetical protein EHM76_05785 [bacterium]|nr:MAG: hypothetical protein EHM76_05785 [bacterium]
MEEYNRITHSAGNASEPRNAEIAREACCDSVAIDNCCAAEAKQGCCGPTVPPAACGCRPASAKQ